MKKIGEENPIPPTEKRTGARKLVDSQNIFPIVGIGASAGGLEALELFLANVPQNSGMAFVIVQHLDPTHKDLMVELLQRVTPMKVFQIKDRTRVKPDCVYIIPPNKDLSILHGVLHLLDPLAPRGLRLPIDFFFRALAQDQKERSIGVILSGMGSDGTLGLRAIKEKAGVVFVQEPASAKFDGMPTSAIQSGLADVTAAVEELPGKIISFLQHVTLLEITDPVAEDSKARSALEKVVILLRAQTGHDFSLYKKNTLYRRIERRMGIHQIDKIANYIRYLQQNPQEVDLLFRELLIGVTSFFRDPDTWERVKDQVMPALLTRKDPNQPLRAWVPACSTGEEAYSLAILFKEALTAQKSRKIDKTNQLQIFATDLDQDAIAKAREGFYPANIAADISEERLNRYFEPVEGGYKVIKSIREMVIFAPHNICMDPPFSKLDILSCRNLLIYLTPELQKKLIPLFHYSLNPVGFLLLGNAETVGGFGNLFEELEGKTRLYRRREPVVKDPIQFPAVFPSRPDIPARVTRPIENIQGLAEKLLLQTYSPAAVLTNETGDIIFISGRTGKYLEPAAGKANWNIFAMARESLNYELSSAFQKALHSNETRVIKNIVIGTNGGRQLVDVTIQPLTRPEALQGMVMVVFKDQAAIIEIKSPAPSGRVKTSKTHLTKVEHELDLARQEVQSVRGQMQASQEELRSINEEMQSTNEELQSTNEELTTSKEEMQSMNEEMQTINQELQTKLEELSHTNNDMKNLIDSTDIATLFLDNDLRVRRFTSETGKLTQLIPGDKGRPITDIASALLYPKLAEDARQVLRNLVKMERQIHLPDGTWYEARILPYRTLENMIDGVVITFSDITSYKKLEAELRGKSSNL